MKKKDAETIGADDGGVQTILCYLQVRGRGLS